MSKEIFIQNLAITIASNDCTCHCEHPKGAWQSLQKRRDCFVSLAMTILIAGFVFILTIYFILGTGVISYAGHSKDTANVQEHIKVHLEKVKLKNHQKYQEMIEKAGGNITHCCICHMEACTKNVLPSQQPLTPQITTPKPPKKF